ncbi:hypothetical protein [Leuconostoc citreum]
MRRFQSIAYNILITDAAQRDLDDIFTYINEKFFCPTNTLSNIKLSILKAAEIPTIRIDVSKRVNKKFKSSETLRIIPDWLKRFKSVLNHLV